MNISLCLVGSYLRYVTTHFDETYVVYVQFQLKLIHIKHTKRFDLQQFFGLHAAHQTSIKKTNIPKWHILLHVKQGILQSLWVGFKKKNFQSDQQNCPNGRFKDSKTCELQIFSRKIREVEKFFNFQTVLTTYLLATRIMPSREQHIPQGRQS